MNTTKELLQIEFRYNDKPKGEYDGGTRTKTVTIGIYDTLEEAITEGNKALAILANSFEVRHDDVFKSHHLFGHPKRLVTNTCYPTNGIQYFASIRQLTFDDLRQTVIETFQAFGRYRDYKNSLL